MGIETMKKKKSKACRKQQKNGICENGERWKKKTINHVYLFEKQEHWICFQNMSRKVSVCEYLTTDFKRKKSIDFLTLRVMTFWNKLFSDQ
jgi:hypothetical protein